ncbi:hypothetical protein ACJMK2_042712, partial [Sinanodonta woodiana]
RGDKHEKTQPTCHELESRARNDMSVASKNPSSAASGNASQNHKQVFRSTFGIAVNETVNLPAKSNQSSFAKSPKSCTSST